MKRSSLAAQIASRMRLRKTNLRKGCPGWASSSATASSVPTTPPTRPWTSGSRSRMGVSRPYASRRTPSRSVSGSWRPWKRPRRRRKRRLLRLPRSTSRSCRTRPWLYCPSIARMPPRRPRTAAMSPGTSTEKEMPPVRPKEKVASSRPQRQRRHRRHRTPMAQPLFRQPRRQQREAAEEGKEAPNPAARRRRRAKLRLRSRLESASQRRPSSETQALPTRMRQPDLRRWRKT
mmetsp:Transcript_48246/g.124260  ORF Transcript_48246/g.124260 Transcript_48246/m.124260 type:complete len:233 (-) Transcript_48246:319-1017(-)